MSSPSPVVALAFALVAAAGARAQAPAGVEDLVALALESSPLLEAARARGAAARARVDLAHADYLPTVELTERWAMTNNPPSAFGSVLNQGRLTPEFQDRLNSPPAVSDWATSFTARYLLSDFGARRARADAAGAESDRQVLLEDAARRDVVHAVRDAWYGLLRKRAAIQVWKATVALLESDEALTRARHEEGASLRSDVLAVGVRRQEAQENLLSARHGAEIAQARLVSVVGGELPALALADQGLGRPGPVPGESSIVEAALTRHPELLALDAAERGAIASARAARRQRRPRVEARAGWEWHGESERFGLERDSYLAAVALTVPVFDGFRGQSQAAEAEARAREARALRRQGALVLELAARTAHHRFVEAQGRIDLAESAVTSAEAARDIVKERYGAGAATVTELLDADRRLTEARVRALDARAAAWTALAAIERIAGVGAGERSPS